MLNGFNVGQLEDCYLTTTALSMKNDKLHFLVQTECSSIRFLLLQRFFNTNAERFFKQLVHVTEIHEI